MAVVVNGERIDPAEIEQEVERLRPYYDQYVRENNPDGGDEQLRGWAKENIIEKVLMRQAALTDPEPVPSEELDAAFEQVKDNLGEMTEEIARREIEGHLRISRLLRKISDEARKPSEEDLLAFYREHPDYFTAPEQVRASHIVKHVNGQTPHEEALEAIRKIKAELDAGKGFEELAAAHSDCPGGNGDLGYFPRGQMVQEFEDVVFGMDVGQVTDVFLTSFGYHIAKVNDKRPAQGVPFEDVRGDIERELAGQLQREATESYVDRLKEKASITDSAD